MRPAIHRPGRRSHSGRHGPIGTGPTLVIGLALAIAGCGTSTTTVPPGGSAGTSTPPVAASPGDSKAPPAPTAVPGGVSISPGPVASRIPTSQTDWGAILDALPQGFPVYPDADVAEPPPEPVSAAFETADGVDQVATWYRDALTDAGFSTVDLSDPLEDGSRVLDSATDLPECRVQLTFRPLGGSTMIVVLYGAGCAGAQG